ncbi:MAG TPA: OsmC family peroxiredoxin [Rhizomicrobium sp.]|jgi:osmotically inducible protein OsmC|nr:OsmC family peroxiredoxin [Rhizomicrobium sp.]
MKRKGSAEWTGDLRTGKGTVSTESGALSARPYGFNTRFGDEKGTNPEELIGAAHASCFSMALSNELAKAGIATPHIETSAVIELKQQDGGFAITSSHLTVKITAKGADRAAAQKAADTAKANCPVSKLLKADISMDTTIEV